MPADGKSAALTIGVSHKMYFSHARTVAWMAEVAEVAARHESVRTGIVRLFAVPQFPSIPVAVDIAAPVGIEIGAQDVAEHDMGAYTGEVSPAVLAELGVTLAEIGHAERRRRFGETDDTVRAKVSATLRNGLAPILCLGEDEHLDPERAAAFVTRQLDSAIAGIPMHTGSSTRRVIVAYEPVWAIGAAEPADPDHVRAVVGALRSRMKVDPRLDDVAVIYGGSAGPGLLSQLGNDVDGLFLGRFAHDPAAFEGILDEALALRRL